MAITSTGYPGQIDTVAWAKMSQFIGARHAVLGYEDWRPSIVTTADRTVRIAIGTGFGDGVMDVNDAAVNVQCPTVTSGSRWDAIVARRTWATSTTTFTRVAGTSVRALPATLQNEPGVVCDQPIALVRVQAGQSLLQEMIDLRSWASKVLRAESLTTISDAPLGTEVVLATDGFRYRRELVLGAPTTVPVPVSTSGRESVSLPAGATSSGVTPEIPWGLPATANTPYVTATAESSGAPILATVRSRSLSGFTLQVHRVDGQAQVNAANIPVMWVAQSR